MGFFDSFGGSKQRADIYAANRQANQYLDQGYKQSQGYYDQAGQYIDPYVQSGGKANAMYTDLIGLNGPDAQSTAYDTLTSNPIFQGTLGQESNAVLRNLNARGQSGGGLAQIAGQRVFQQTAGDWLNRFRDAGQSGFQAAGTRAGIATGQGDNAYGYGATKAANRMSLGQSIADTRNAGVNNLIGLLGTGLKAYSTFK